MVNYEHVFCIYVFFIVVSMQAAEYCHVDFLILNLPICYLFVFMMFLYTKLWIFEVMEKGQWVDILIAVKP